MIDMGKFYFLSRPRRFGKSLTVSTLKYLFQGERALFRDTWIDSRWDWETQHPVVHISMTEVDSSSPQRLEESLLYLLKEIYESFDLILDVRLVKDAFRRLLSSVHRKTGQRIALLIDEYDKPILDHLHQPA